MGQREENSLFRSALPRDVTYPVNNLNIVIDSGVGSTPISLMSAVLTISSSVDFISAVSCSG